MWMLISLLLPVIPITAFWLALRHGPWRTRLWRHENPLGFALFVGGIAFLFGYLGPLIWAPDANQGPLLGIFYTGPVGTLVGLVWGFVRAWRRSALRRV